MILEKFTPDLYVRSIYHIDLIALKNSGITSIITDLDNTLVETDSPLHTPELVSWLDNLQEIGFKVIIVSNNNKSRVEEFAKPLTVPYIYAAKKPIKIAFQKALELLHSRAVETVVIGDQILTDILGGNRMGMHTILVAPISRKEGLGTKFNRRLERIILPRLKKRGLLPWED